MGKLVVSADIHGSKEAWRKITSLLRPQDSLAIAGDLFDTIYGSTMEKDFQPDFIKKNIRKLPCPLYYVYGNCDQREYMTGYDTQTSFVFDGLSVLLNHGHLRLPDLTDYQLIIEGHSHMPRLDWMMGKVFLNPGSPTHPRIEFGTYATVENLVVRICHFETGKVLSDLDLRDIM